MFDLRKNGISGEKARKFRKSVVQTSSTSASPVIRTVKFPLETPSGGYPFEFEDAKKLFDIVEGTGKGTLAGFLFATHLSGFRFFGASAETMTHRQKKQLPQEDFARVWNIHFLGCPAPNLSETLASFQKEPRKNKDYTVEKLVGDLFSILTGGTKANEKSFDKHPKVFEVSNELAKAFLGTFSSRKEMATNPRKCLLLLQTILQKVDLKFPDLLEKFNDQEVLTPKESAIDFDDLLLRQTSLQDKDPLLPHKVVAQKAHALRLEHSSVTDSNLKSMIVTATNNALSWLFGSGLNYFNSSDINKIEEDYNLPCEKIARQVKDWAVSIEKDVPLFNMGNYSKFRTGVGGKISSWVSNYWKRLNELYSITENTHDTTSPFFNTIKNNKDFYRGTDISHEELVGMVNSLEDLRVESHEAIKKAMGISNSLPDEKDFKKVEDYSLRLETICGIFRIIEENIKKDRDTTISTIKIPDCFGTINKIPKFSGGLPDINNDIKIAQSNLKLHTDSLNHKLAGVVEDSNTLIKNTAEQLKANTRCEKCFTDAELERFAQRKILQQILDTVLKTNNREIYRAMVTSLSTAIESTAIEYEPTKKKLINELVYNQKGRLFRHPFSRAKHQPMFDDSLVEFKFNAFEMVNTLRESLTKKDQLNADENRAVQSLNILLYRFRMSLLPHLVDTELMSLNLDNIPYALKAAIHGKKEITSQVASKLLNLHISEISGLYSMLYRDEFFLRAVFKIDDSNDYLYMPKSTVYSQPLRNLPEKYPVPEDLDRENSTWDDLRKYLKKTPADTEVRKLLRQVPHDWGIDLKTRNTVKSEERVVFIGEESGKGEDKKSNFKVKDSSSWLRIVGPSARKRVLDEGLVTGKSKDGGTREYNIIIEQSYNQKINGDVIEIVPKGLNVSLAVPYKEPLPKESVDLSETMIGIDLGEYGIGYAVCSSKDNFDLKESGFIPIPTLRNLIRSVNKYRGKTQPRQKFQQKFSTKLAELKENATGDVVHAIDSLCYHFKGFPILESSIQNLSSGGNNLKLVYDKISHLYIYSGIDAHKTARGNHWCNSKHGLKWTHPHLFEGDQPLGHYPGVSVHPAGTSQTCSECGINPIKIVEQSSNKEFVTDVHGIVTVTSDGIDYGIMVLDKYEPRIQQMKDGTKRKEEKRNADIEQEKHGKRMLYKHPTNSGRKFAMVDLINQIRNQIRQSPELKSTHDSSQSRYYCANAKCRYQMHADENAAINIVRKWVVDKGISLAPKAHVNKKSSFKAAPKKSSSMSVGVSVPIVIEIEKSIGGSNE